MMTQIFIRFLKNESGASATEFAMFLPILMALLLASLTAFDMFRTAQNVEKATFTIGDMLAREKSSLTKAKLTDMLTLLRQTVYSANDGGLRVSSIGRVNGEFVLRWSQTVGNNVPGTALNTSLFPEMADGDSVLLTESFVPHEAMVAGFGISDVTFSARAAYRPRFVSSIAFQ
ncbi:TadE/TadG family type IV pilus assembly protein [Devosia sp. Leaf64]|jgi:Flp pilus assembly protein TadG|uniref:TadE/TadG family type IV pilus assembly protein n=1 Tax=Devosia sp. Leaf64 TaxID=1736229 RepID=UPI0007155920|nr:TadE/TadG family type IV pilus assembly protein [Devosia sp. Leaf64]KQN77189.1 hypothetical protein ASE94_16900 [Devosia sp. Leaf64]